MRRLLLCACVLTLAGCAWFSSPPEQKIAPGSRVIYHGGGFAVWSICDRGNLIYMTEQAPTVAVVPGGCALDNLATPAPPVMTPMAAPAAPACPTCPPCPPAPAAKAAPKAAPTKPCP